MIVSFKTAQFAEKRGFDEATEWYYDEGILKRMPQGKEVNKFHWNRYNDMGCVAAPYFDQLKNWLEERNRYIAIRPEYYTDGINWNWQVSWYSNFMEDSIWSGTAWYGDDGEYPTSKIAYDAALHKALYVLKELCIYSNVGDLQKYWNMSYDEIRDLIDSIDQNEFGQWSFLNLSEKQLDLLEKTRNEKRKRIHRGK